MSERLEYIDGIKGYACLIVLMGHSVACIFPNMIFGDSYQAHSVIEGFIHSSPFNIVFSSGHMNGLFFFLSGWMIARKRVEKNFFNRMVSKFLKFIPMVLIGVFFAYLVMKFDLLYCHTLMEYSYAANYVGGANSFMPSLLGKDGVLYDAFITTFINSSRYDSPLWFLTVLFWGSLLVESIEKCFNNKNVRMVIYIILYCAVMKLEFIDWRIPYLGFILTGAVISSIEFKKKLPNFIAILMFIFGLYITAPSEYLGFYKPLVYMSVLGMNLKVIGIILVVVAVANNPSLQGIFNTKTGRWLSKYSLGIYTIHWSMVISVSCGVTYFMNVSHGVNYMVSGLIGIVFGLAATLLFAVIFTEDIYSPYRNWLFEIRKRFSVKEEKNSDGKENKICNILS